MHTIYQLVTKPINQNVAIIRISGKETFSTVSKLFNSKIKPNGSSIVFRKLFIKNKFVDDVLILTFQKPNSFTGEDVIELQCHGSMFIVKKIMSELHKLGLQEAKRGEFTQRAFFNKKLDLTQSMAINTLINSENEELAQRAAESLNGAESSLVKESMNYITDIYSRIQVGIDYPENTDLPEYNLEVLKKELIKYLKKLESIITDSKKLQKVSEGIKVAIIGIPNAGKSTLLNALLNEDKAIVTDIEGTTRDIVEGSLYVNGIKVTFQDTAGIRDAKGKVEQIGIEKSKKALEHADIAFLLIDPTKSIKQQEEFFKPLIEKYKNKLTILTSKSDLKKSDKYKNISATKGNVKVVLSSIEKFFTKKENNFTNLSNSILISQEHINSFNKIFNSLSKVAQLITDSSTVDLIMLEMQDCLEELGKVIGIKVDQDYFTNLFANFCLGK